MDERTERRHALAEDVGASRQEIQDAVRAFQRRQEDRLLDARQPAQQSPGIQPVFHEVTITRTALPPAPLTLGVGAGSPAGGSPPPLMNTVRAMLVVQSLDDPPTYSAVAYDIHGDVVP